MNPRKKSTTPQIKRVAAVTFATVAEKEAAMAHAASKGTTLANLLNMLLAADIKASGGAPPVAE